MPRVRNAAPAQKRDTTRNEKSDLSVDFDDYAEVVARLSSEIARALDNQFPANHLEKRPEPAGLFQVCIVGKCSEWPEPLLSHSNVIAVIVGRELVNDWRELGALKGNLAALAATVRREGAQSAGANEVAWHSVFVIICTPNEETHQSSGPVDLVAINGPLSDQSEDAHDLLRRYRVEHLLSNSEIIRSEGVSTVVMPRWSDDEEETPMPDHKGFSEIFTSGVVYVHPAALVRFTARCAIGTFFVLIIAITPIVVDGITTAIALSDLLKEWLFSIFFASAFLFLVVAELAKLSLARLQETDLVEASAKVSLES